MGGYGAPDVAATLMTKAADYSRFGQKEGLSNLISFNVAGSVASGIDVAPTLVTDLKSGFVERSPELRVRVFTPLERERLMGFPDGWTAVEWKGRPLSDHARMFMLGNSIGVNCMDFIGEGIRMFEEATGGGR